jgi:hypothetical protein
MRPFAKTRAGCAPAGEPSPTPSTKRDHILDFRKNSSLTVLSPEKWFIPPWSFLFAGPIATGTLTAVERRGAPIAHPRYELNPMTLFRRGRSKRKMACFCQGWGNLLINLNFAEETGFGIRSVRLGFPSAWAWISFSPAWNSFRAG